MARRKQLDFMPHIDFAAGFLNWPTLSASGMASMGRQSLNVASLQNYL
jgi:hypothetical protein